MISELTNAERVDSVLDDPGRVVRSMLLDAMKMFYLAHKREPARVKITPDMENALRHHVWRTSTGAPHGSLLFGTPFNPLRPSWLFGMAATYDSSDFVLE